MDLFGNLEQKQKEIQTQLESLRIQKSSNSSELTVTLNGLGQILDIEVSLDKIDLSDSEQLQDILLLTLNEAIAEAKQQEAAVSQASMQDMLPGGLDGLKNMFG